MVEIILIRRAKLQLISTLFRNTNRHHYHLRHHYHHRRRQHHHHPNSMSENDIIQGCNLRGIKLLVSTETQEGELDFL